MMHHLRWRKFVRKYWAAIALMISLVLIELFLRLMVGFGNPPLLQADPEIGYVFQPNQKLVRFGKRVEYNQYSQRSAPITPTKPATVLRILMIGDSILNGGSLTDQHNTISALLQDQFSSHGRITEVLNASAGSWGLGNQLSYLRKFGTFQSDLVILEIGSHDLIQPKSTSDRIDRDPHYPSQRPFLALQEVIIRYIWPSITRYLHQSPPSTEIPASQRPFFQAQKNRHFLSEMITNIREANSLAVVMFMPELQQLVPKVREPTYKIDLLKLLKQLAVPIVDFQIHWANLPVSEITPYFRDGLHLTESGNRAVANILYEQLCHQTKGLC